MSNKREKLAIKLLTQTLEILREKYKSGIQESMREHSLRLNISEFLRKDAFPQNDPNKSEQPVELNEPLEKCLVDVAFECDKDFALLVQREVKKRMLKNYPNLFVSGNLINADNLPYYTKIERDNFMAGVIFGCLRLYTPEQTLFLIKSYQEYLIKTMDEPELSPERWFEKNNIKKC